jgi:hypothetical protein
MSTTNIKLRRSAVPGKIPTVGQLDLGEVAINTYDGKIFIKKDDGAESVITLGETGFTGSQGDQGVQGFTGSRGDVGFTGSQGESGEIQWIRKTENYTAVSGDGIIADTTGGSFTITLPATPSLGDYIVILDGGNWSVNNLTVARNGSTIEGEATDVIFDLGDIRVDLVFDGSTWQVYTSIGQTGFTGSQGDIGFTGSQGESGTIDWVRKTENYTTASGEGVIADTTGGSFTVTLPANPSIGDYVIVVDGGNWQVNNLTIARNGSTIESEDTDVILNIDGIRVDFVFDGSTWQVYTSIGKTGFTGSIGFTGSQGDIGFTGSAGESGTVEWLRKTENYAASSGEGIIADTIGGSFTITLPATPSLGDYIIILDGGDWAANNLTVARNGSTIEGSPDDLILNVSDIRVDFVFDGTTWQVYTSAGQTGFTGSQGESGTIEWIRKTENYTTENGEGIIADTSGGSFTITLPATPSLGDYIVIVDGGNWEVNNLTIARNGSTIEGFSSDLVLDVGDTRVDFVFDGTTWQVFSNVGQRGFTGSAAVISISDDTSTDESRFISFVGSTSGNTQSFGVSSSKLFFNPSTGTLNATEFNSLSDETLKEDMHIVNNALDIINNIEGFKFAWKDTKKLSLGVSAQRLERIIPELVTNGNYKTVNYNGLIAILIEAIKELDRKIK